MKAVTLHSFWQYVPKSGASQNKNHKKTSFFVEVRTFIEFCWLTCLWFPIRKKKIVQFAHVQSNNCQNIHFFLKKGEFIELSDNLKTNTKRLFVYLSFNLYHFGHMWHLCTIYCFQMYCAIQGFQKRKPGLKNSWNKYDTSAGLKRINTCSMLHLEPHLIQSCRVGMKHFFPAALLHCLNILYVLYIDVNSVVLQFGLSAVLWHCWRCNGVARGGRGSETPLYCMRLKTQS